MARKNWTFRMFKNTAKELTKWPNLHHFLNIGSNLEGK